MIFITVKMKIRVHFCSFEGKPPITILRQKKRSLPKNQSKKSCISFCYFPLLFFTDLYLGLRRLACKE